MKAPGMVALAIVVGGLSYVIGHHDGTAGAEETARRREAMDAMHHGIEWTLGKRLDDEASRKSAALRDSTPRVVAIAAADSVHNVITALEDSLRGSLSITDSLLVYQELAFDLRGENRKLRAALAAAVVELSAWRQEAIRYKAMADSAAPIMVDLSNALEAEQRAHTCRVLFLPCPSRGLMLLTGVAIGLTAAAALH